MKPGNRAARRKPCKKQASKYQSSESSVNSHSNGVSSDNNSNYSRSDSDIYSLSTNSFSDSITLTKPQTQHLTTEQQTNHSTTSSSESTDHLLNHHAFPTIEKRVTSGVHNPYRKQSKPPTTISNRIKSLLRQDDKKSKPVLRNTLSGNTVQDENSSSSYSASSDESSVQWSLNEQPRRSTRLMKPSPLRQDESLSSMSDICLPRAPYAKVIMSSSSSSGNVREETPNELGAATFQVDSIRAMVQTYSQSGTGAAESQEAQTIMNNILTLCSNLEQEQKDYRQQQLLIEEQMHAMQHATKTLQQSVENVSAPGHVPMYQQETSSWSDMSSCEEDSIPDESLKIPSKFSRLNINSDGDTFLSQTESSVSTVTNCCPLEEINSQDSLLPPLHVDQSLDEINVVNEEAQVPECDPSISLTSSAKDPVPISLTITGLSSQSSYDTPDEKHQESVRFMSQNCRGAFPQSVPSDEHYEPCMNSFKNMAADVVLLSECNVDWRVHENEWTAQLLNKAIWRPCPTKTVVSSCSRENYDRSSFQTGGVLSLFLDKMPSRVLKNESDPYGRWTRTHIQIKRGNLVVYNTYRTHAKTLETAGIHTPWMHQWRAMREKTGKDLDPRSQHMLDLVALVEQDVCEGNIPLLIGDFNEDVDDSEENGLNILEQSPHVVNAFLHFHGLVPSSRQNSRSIFHIYMSPKLIPFVDKLGICTDLDGFDSSDHIPFFMDIKASFFSSQIHLIQPQSKRVLQMYDTPTIQKYTENVLLQFRAHNIFQRIDHLRQYIQDYQFDQHAINTLEKLDKQITNIRLLSEKNLIKSPTRYKSTEVAKYQVKRIRLLETLRRRYKKQRDVTDVLVRLEQLEFCEEITPDNLNQVITQEKADLKQLQEDIDVHREEHLQRLSEINAAENNKDVSVVMKEMKQREKQKRAWRKISFVTKQRSNGVARLGIPKGCESASTKEIWDLLQDPGYDPEWSFITDANEIERRLIEWQKLHYHQANETPFTSTHWYNALNPNVISTEEVVSNLNGEMDMSDLHVSSASLLREMSQNLLPKMRNEMTDVTVAKYQSFYKKVPEKTSSSPSGLHMGHWKAAALDNNISSVLVAIISIAVANSYPLQRWRRVTGVLLEKKEGHPFIHKFRTIHLIESDLNYVMRMVWGRELPRWADKHNGINDNQYGGRKGVQAQSAALNKTITCDVIRYYGEEASLIDNDAQACYDRIIPVFVAYALMRLGLPIHLARFQTSWLEKAVYELKMSLGLSDTTYSHTPEHPLYGTGQGTGWSPPSWTAVSDLISRVMDKFSPGLRLVHPDGSFIQRIIDAFVDDVNSGITNEGLQKFAPSNLEVLKKYDNIYDQTKHTLQLYSNLLFTTGGKLALHKCAVYILQTIWKNGKRNFVKTHLNQLPMEIYQGIDKDSQRVKLENPSKARRMLGIYVSPDGNSKDQYNILRQKSELWSKKVQTQHLHRYETVMAYTQGILKSLEFPLGPSLLSEIECQKIQSPALTTSLKKMGVVSTIARQLIYGPHRYGCLGLPELYCEMGRQKIELLLGHIRKQDKTGEIVQVALGCLQQEVGLSSFVLQNEYDTYKSIITKSWLQQTWEFLSKIGGKIKMDGAWVPQPTFENDVNIAETIISWDISDEMKYKINICRLYKRCYFLGDLLDVSGTRFLPHSLSVKHRAFHLDKFPRIILPPSFESVWKSAIRALVTQNSLGRMLGPLINHRSQEWVMDESGTILAHQQYSSPPKLYLKQSHRNFGMAKSTLCIPFEYFYAVNVSYTTNSIKVVRERIIQKPGKSPSLDDIFKTSKLKIYAKRQFKFREYINSLPHQYRRNLGDIKNIHRVKEIAKFLDKGKLIGVGDATVDTKLAAHSYVLEDENETVSITGSAPVDSDIDDISSNRAETCSVIAILTMATAISLFFELKTPKIRVYCDNDEARRYRDFSRSTYSKLCQRDVDVKMEVNWLLKFSPVQVIFCDVQGHQDERESFVYDTAAQEVRRNIDVDLAAKHFLQNSDTTWSPHQKPEMFQAQKIALYLQDTLVTGDIKYQICLHRHGHQLEQRIGNSLHLSANEMQLIEWEGLETAFGRLDHMERIVKMKIIHMQLPTRSILYNRKGPNSYMCPRCDKKRETFLHVIQCGCRQNRASHRLHLATLRQTLRKSGTHILLINTIDMLLSSTQSSKKLIFRSPPMGDVTKIEIARKLFYQQKRLGPAALFRGLLTRNWALAQNICSGSDNVEHKDLGWLKQVIRALWQYTKSMWIDRCKMVSGLSKDDPDNLTHQELKFAIRTYLRLQRKELSPQEKSLHLNISKGINIAHTKTLVRWITLLKQERSRTTRQQSEKRLVRSRNQTLEHFFRRTGGQRKHPRAS